MYIICLPRPVFEPGSTQNIPSTLADHAQKVSFVFSDTTELCEWHLNNSKSGLMILVWSPIKQLLGRLQESNLGFPAGLLSSMQQSVLTTTPCYIQISKGLYSIHHSIIFTIKHERKNIPFNVYAIGIYTLQNKPYKSILKCHFFIQAYLRSRLKTP